MYKITKYGGKNLTFFLGGIFFFLILITNVFSGTTGKIAGTIQSGETGEVLPSANVVIKARIVKSVEQSLSMLRGAAADIEGNYFILNISPGIYVLECSVIGYQKVVKKPIHVQVDRTTTVNFSLAEETIAGETVYIVADKPLVEKDLTSASAKVAGETINELPVETFDEVLSLQSGITTGISGGLHIRGGRSSEIRYYVDGIAVSNPFNNALAVPVENNVIQELEVISGTFNAEYGQAQSGIVNIVTREGTEQFSGSFSAYSGDFVSNNTNIFWNIDDFNPAAQQYFEANISGPILSSKLKFFASGKYTDQDNWIFGKRVFMPIDSSSFASTNPDEWYIESTGDSAYVSMNSAKNMSGQVKLTYQMSPSIKFSYNLMANISEGRDYTPTIAGGSENSGGYRLNPDSRRTDHIEAVNHLFNLTHTISPSIFYTLKFALYENDFKSYVYDDPYDPGYVAVFGRNRQPGNVFSTGGIDNRHIYKNSITYAARADLNMQINNYNFIKIGAEYRDHRLDYEDFGIIVDPFIYGDWERRIPPLSSIDHDKFSKNPVEFAAFIQDKIEYDDLIVNVGVRFDYFNANSKVPVDLRDPANKLFLVDAEVAYESVKEKAQVSPRLGLTFPITDRGVIHAAYGQFFQIPEFERLYENPEFEVIGYAQTYIGNANLDVQRTDMYEIGLQQQLAQFLAIDITAFYRNIRNLMGSELYETYRTDIRYGRYANSSHGAVRGVTFAAKIRVPSIGVTADMNYTYQSAKGIASNPKQAFYDAAGRNESIIVLNPLNWDLRHTFNAFLC